MKLSRSRIAMLAFLCGTSLLQADILILKNGTKVEGNILNESPTAIRMKYRLTPKIWDEKDFQMTEIQQVIKQTPQEVELIELKKLIPTPDLMPADKYEQLIQDRVRPFINKYQGSPEAKEAEGIADSLQAEKKRVSNGELKMEGRWLNAGEAKGEQYNIQAYKLHEEMKAEMAKFEWTEALTIFDKFAKAHPPYTASTYYPAVVADAKICMEKLGAQLSKMALEQPALLKQREEGLKKLADGDKQRTKAAIDDEKGKWRAQSDAQRRSNVRWIEPYKYDLPSILAAQKVVVSELTRLEAINMEDMKVRNEAFVAVYRKIGEGDYAGGAAAYERIQGFSNVTEYREIVADLKAQLLKLYGELVRKGSSGPAPVSGSSAVTGQTSSSVDDRVARILAASNGGQPAAAPGTAPAAAPAMATPGAAPAPGAAAVPGTTPAAAPAMATPGAAPAPGAAPTAAPATNPAVQQRPAVAPAPQVQAPVAAPVYAPPAEESNVQTYIMVGMGALLVLFGILAFKKKKAE